VTSERSLRRVFGQSRPYLVILFRCYSDPYQARWSAEIEVEWKRNLIAARPELAERIERTQAVMRRALPDALVTDYAHLIPTLTLPDPSDRHVLAAAIVTSAEVIVTFNGRDFPDAALAPHGLTAQHPDAFLQGLATERPSEVLESARECLVRLVRPPVTASDYIDVLRRLGLAETAAFLSNHLSTWAS
jgi:predicted nucleic acid-binding protein